MANALFDKGREGILDHSIDMTAATVKLALVRGYTFSASHQNLSDVTGAGGSVVGTAQALASKTYTSGVLSAAAVTYSAVASGAAIPALVLYNDTGTASTSRLIAYIDTATGLPVTPNGGDITFTPDSGSNHIFKL
jgi:hypothetical protein